MSKILVVEDDTYLRRDLKEILNKNEYDVVTASSVGEACCYVSKETDIDLYLLDVWLPDGEGFEICKAIRLKNQKPVIFLTASDDEEHVITGLNLGADDYVIKPFRTRELLSRIQANLRRTQAISGTLACSILKSKELILDMDQGIVMRNGVDLRLSPLEYGILCKLMENSEKIIKREQLLDALWDSVGSFVEDNTLSVNMSRLRNKIGGEYIETIRGFGYRFTGKVQRGNYE